MVCIFWRWFLFLYIVRTDVTVYMEMKESNRYVIAITMRSIISQHQFVLFAFTSNVDSGDAPFLLSFSSV